jgi:hypothetical protein
MDAAAAVVVEVTEVVAVVGLITIAEEVEVAVDTTMGMAEVTITIVEAVVITITIVEEVGMITEVAAVMTIVEEVDMTIVVEVVMATIEVDMGEMAEMAEMDTHRLPPTANNPHGCSTNRLNMADMVVLPLLDGRLPRHRDGMVVAEVVVDMAVKIVDHPRNISNRPSNGLDGCKDIMGDLLRLDPTITIR